MKKNPRELRAQREELINQAKAKLDAAEAQDRSFTDEERTEYKALLEKADQLRQRAEEIESMSGLEATLGARRAPAFNRIGRGDSEVRAMAHYLRTGDVGGMRDLAVPAEQEEVAQGLAQAMVVKLPSVRELRAAVDSTMNITTAADGASAVPTGFSGQIAMRMTEVRLAEKLGVRKVPGKGTTVNFPYQNAEPVVFATTAEQADDHSVVYERDVLVLGNKAFTLVKKTRRVELTSEILDDEDANLMGAIGEWIGQEMGVTHNTALLTEVAASGTSLKTFAAAAAIAAGEPEDIVFNNALGFYLDDANPGAWVMRNPTFGDIASITGNARLYAETPGGSFKHEVLGYPVFLSGAAAAIAASAKSTYFGNWFSVGMREDPALRLLRNPYRVPGLVILEYDFRLVYGVLTAGGIGYGVHPSA